MHGAPDDKWDAIAAIVKAEDGLGRALQRNRRFTWAWAARQFGEPVATEPTDAQQRRTEDGSRRCEQVSGAESCRLMRQAKVTIKRLAEALSVTQGAVKRARKDGVTDSTWLAWLASAAPKAEKKVTK